MCPPVVAAALVSAAATTATMVVNNQQIQHAKGAAQAQQAQADASAAEAAKVGPAQTSIETAANSSLAAAEERRKSALRRGILSTIKTSGSGVSNGFASIAPAAYAPGSKTTLG